VKGVGLCGEHYAIIPFGSLAETAFSLWRMPQVDRLIASLEENAFAEIDRDKLYEAFTLPRSYSL